MTARARSTLVLQSADILFASVHVSNLLKMLKYITVKLETFAHIIVLHIKLREIFSCSLLLNRRENAYLRVTFMIDHLMPPGFTTLHLQ
jgi:hypothetical protein